MSKLIQPFLPYFAMIEPAMPLTDIFLIRDRKKKKHLPTLDVRQEFNGYQLHWSARQAPTIGDQSVLYAAVALAGMQKQILDTDTSHTHGQSLRAMLNLEGAITGQPVALVCGRWQDLAGAATKGTQGGMSRKSLFDSLKRLAEITIWVKKDTEETSTRVLSFVYGNDKQFFIALNWRLTNAMLGNQFVRISLEERRDLTTDCARALHARLSASLRPGAAQRVGLDSLASHLWAGIPTPIALRKRRFTLRAALQELGELDHWDVSLDGAFSVVTRFSPDKKGE